MCQGGADENSPEYPSVHVIVIVLYLREEQRTVYSCISISDSAASLPASYLVHVQYARFGVKTQVLAISSQPQEATNQPREGVAI